MKIDCSICTPEEFKEKTGQDIFEIYNSLADNEELIIECVGCGFIKISKINNRLKIIKKDERDFC